MGGRGFYGGLFDNMAQVNYTWKIQYGCYLGAITQNSCLAQLADILKSIAQHIYFLKIILKYRSIGVRGVLNGYFDYKGLFLNMFFSNTKQMSLSYISLHSSFEQKF